jgi:hypothetical protein
MSHLINPIPRLRSEGRIHRQTGTEQIKLFSPLLGVTRQDQRNRGVTRKLNVAYTGNNVTSIKEVAITTHAYYRLEVHRTPKQALEEKPLWRRDSGRLKKR